MAFVMAFDLSIHLSPTLMMSYFMFESLPHSSSYHVVFYNV